MELILIRHSITQGNLEHRFIGVIDSPIIPAGEELARKISPTLPAVDHVYRSPMLRCRQTADLLWPLHKEQTVIAELRETDFGPFEGKNHEELKDDPLYQQWITTADFANLPVGESPEACAKRAAAGLSALLSHAKAHRFSRVGVVTHGGTLMALLSTLVDDSDYYLWRCQNCGGFLVEAQDQPLSLRILSPMGNTKRLIDPPSE